MLKSYKSTHSSGFTLLEVLIAILITAFGLLGLAGLMSRMQVANTEGFDRSQALSLLWNMTERLQAAVPSSTTAASAFAGGATVGSIATVGTGVTSYAYPCTGTGAARDLCEWNFAVQGATECKTGSSSSSTGPCGAVTNNVGAMNGALGCVELLQVPNPANGVCTPAVFRVSVAWAGLVDSAAPVSTADSLTSNQCGKGAFARESLRRIVAQQVTIGMPFCTP